MKKFELVREYKTYMFELGDAYFKVWEAHGGGYWVEQVEVTGEKQGADTLWAGDLPMAERLAKLMLEEQEGYFPMYAGCAEGNCVEPEHCENHNGGK